jgi:hypothetical protein
VEDIDEWLVIQDNPLLADLDGLGALVSMGWMLKINDNAILPACAAEALHQQLVDQGWTGTADISGNWDAGTCD